MVTMNRREWAVLLLVLGVGTGVVFDGEDVVEGVWAVGGYAVKLEVPVHCLIVRFVPNDGHRAGKGIRTNLPNPIQQPTSDQQPSSQKYTYTQSPHPPMACADWKN